jgi:hypothetical protein
MKLCLLFVAMNKNGAIAGHSWNSNKAYATTMQELTQSLYIQMTSVPLYAR